MIGAAPVPNHRSEEGTSRPSKGVARRWDGTHRPPAATGVQPSGLTPIHASCAQNANTAHASRPTTTAPTVPAALPGG